MRGGEGVSVLEECYQERVVWRHAGVWACLRVRACVCVCVICAHKHTCVCVCACVCMYVQTRAYVCARMDLRLVDSTRPQ